MNILHTSVLLFVFSTVFSVSADSGRWYKPFNAGVNSRIEDAAGTGNYIWFTTPTGYGRLNTVSGTAEFFSLSELNRFPGETDTYLAVGDSDHIAVCYDEGRRIDVYNGSTWNMILAPGEHRQVLTNAKNELWVTFKDSGDIVGTFDGNNWKTFPLGISGKKTITGMELDSAGTLWFITDSSFMDSTPDGLVGRDIYELYRFDGSSSSKVSGSAINLSGITRDVHGRLWFYNDTAIYALTGSAFSPVFTNSRLQPEWYSPRTIDSDGNLWLLPKGVNKTTRINLADPAATWTDTNSVAWSYGPLVSCSNGVYKVEHDGFRYYRNNDTSSVFISSKNIWGDACGASAKLLFRKDGTILGYWQKNEAFFPNYSHEIIEYKNQHCRPFSAGPGGILTGMIEMSDGTLLAGTERQGLFKFSDAQWKPLAGSESLPLYQDFVEDRNGKIWGLLDTNRLFHQTDFGWELIDAKNSNLPPFGNSSTYSSPYSDVKIKTDAEGAIWLLLDSAVARTSDGYHWTIFNRNNSNLPTGRLITMFNDSAGAIVVVGLSNCQSTNCSEIIRGVYRGTGWTLDTIPPPRALMQGRGNNKYYEDMHGDRWLITPDMNYALKHCYRSTDSIWTEYDATKVPYELADFIGEDAAGRLFFKDYFSETVVFDRSAERVTTAGRQRSTARSLSVRRTGSKGLQIDFTLQKKGPVSLAIFSLDGRLVQTLFTGQLQVGSYRRNFSVNYAPGVYFAHLGTPGAVHTEKVIVR